MTLACAALNSFSIASSVSLLLADSAAVMLDAIRLLLAMTLPSWSTSACRLGRVVRREVGGLQDGIDLGLGVHHRRIGDGNAAACAVRSASNCFSCRAAVSSRSRAAEPRLLMVSSMFFHGFAERVDDRFVGAEFGDLAELCERDLLGFLHFLGAFVQCLLVAAMPATPAPDWQGSRSAPQVAGLRPVGECPVRSGRASFRRDAAAPCRRRR